MPCGILGGVLGQERDCGGNTSKIQLQSALRSTAPFNASVLIQIAELCLCKRVT